MKTARITSRRRATTLRRLVLAVAVAWLAALAFAGGARGQASPEQITPDSLAETPRGFALSGEEAVAVAERVPQVIELRRTEPDVDRYVFITGQPLWEVNYAVGDEYRVTIEVDGADGRVERVYTGYEARDFLVRGELGGTAENPVVWVLFTLLFLAPFVDVRRARRLLHLDLLVLAAFGISYAFYATGKLDWSVPLVYPPLLYLLVRVVMIARGRGPGRDRGPLVPHAPTVLLAVGLVALVGARAAINVAGDTQVIDVGFASVVGIDRIVNGEELYVDNGAHADTYGPIAYLAYGPWEAIFPTDLVWDDVPAAHAGALAWDLLTILGLLLLGIRARPGPEGRRLGLALGWAWAAYPFTLLALTTNTHDGLIAVFVVAVLLALDKPAARGALLGLAAAAKFAPAAMAAVVLRAWRTEQRRRWAVAGAVFAAALVLPILLYLPPGGLREFWDCTLGFQLSRESIYSPWGLWDSLEWLQLPVQVLAIAAIGATALLVPRERDVARTAALAAAALIAVQLPATHWFYFYLLWILAPVLMAVFSPYGEPGATTPGGRPDEPLITGG